MAFIPRPRDVAPRAWAVATWAVPFVTQILLAVAIAASWLLGKVFVGAPGAMLFLASAAVVLVVSAATAAVFLRSASPRAQGLALGIAGSYAVVLIGGLLYGVWVIQW